MTSISVSTGASFAIVPKPLGVAPSSPSPCSHSNPAANPASPPGIAITAAAASIETLSLRSTESNEPPPSPSSDQQITYSFVVHTFAKDQHEFTHEFHNRPVDIETVHIEYLFARLAWTVIMFVKPFITAYRPRLVAHITQPSDTSLDPRIGSKMTIEWMNDDTLRNLYGGGGSRNASPKKRKLGGKGSRDGEEEHDDGSTECDSDEWSSRVAIEEEEWTRGRPLKRALHLKGLLGSGCSVLHGLRSGDGLGMAGPKRFYECCFFFHIIHYGWPCPLTESGIGTKSTFRMGELLGLMSIRSSPVY